MEKKKTWVCACGAENDGKFCTSCGKAHGDNTVKSSGDAFQEMMMMQMQMKQMELEKEKNCFFQQFFFSNKKLRIKIK